MKSEYKKGDVVWVTIKNSIMRKAYIGPVKITAINYLWQSSNELYTGKFPIAIKNINTGNNKYTFFYKSEVI